MGGQSSPPKFPYSPLDMCQNVMQLLPSSIWSSSICSLFTFSGVSALAFEPFNLLTFEPFSLLVGCRCERRDEGGEKREKGELKQPGH